MPSAAREVRTLLATVALGLSMVLTGCGGSSGGGAAAPSSTDAPGPLASTGVTDGRTGPAVTATDADGVKELAPGGRPDPSDPPRTGGRREGIGAGDGCPDVELLPGNGNIGQIEASTLCLLNGVRADNGLRPLQTNGSLARAALAHSADMVANSYFAHEGRNGSQVKDRIEATGYLPKNAAWTIGENLAWGTGALATPKAIVNAWMNSPGHRDNILKPVYSEIGFGIVTGNPDNSSGDGATYTTAFGSVGQAAATTPAPNTPPPASGVAGATAKRKAATAKAKQRRASSAKRRAKAKRAAQAKRANSTS